MKTLLCFFLLTSIACAQKPKKSAYPPLIEGTTAEVYKTVDEVELNLYIFKPEGLKAGDQRPAVVFFFGGGWNAGSPTQFEGQCEHFAKQGMVAITVDYRVASRHQVKVVSCVEDAKSAIRYVRKNAERLGIDPDRIVAGGGSAGGHLAAATGTIEKFDRETEDLSISSKPNAMMLFNPACVLAPVEGGHPSWNEKARAFKARAGVKSKEISPFHHVKKGTPPTIIFHGKADTTVPYVTAEMFTKAMTEAGNRCELVGFADMPHGFFNQGKFNNKPFEESLAKAEAFLRELKFLPVK
jgi:acetyl esterase/lipase